MNRYEKEINKDETQRDKAILGVISAIYLDIRNKARVLSSDVIEKAGDNTDYFNERNRKQLFAKKTNKALKPDYLKRDTFSKARYVDEYSTAYYQSVYQVTNEGIRQGYKFKLPKYTEKQFKKALNYPLSKLMDPDQLKTARALDVQQIYTSIVAGVEQGKSLQGINRDIDIKLGYRNAKGQWIANPELRKGQQYRTRRILRTEIGRIRSDAATDQWIQQQSVVPSKLIWVATLDDRTRSQSASMDGQVANNEGMFEYPNRTVARQRHSGNPAYDINERCTTITEDPEYPQDKRIQRGPQTGENKVKPYQNFKDYAKDTGLKRNKFGEIVS